MELRSGRPLALDAAPSAGLGVLREQMARAEIGELLAGASADSADALIVHALARLDEAIALEEALRKLVADVEHAPSAASALLEAFLRRTAPPTLVADLRALRKTRGAQPSLGALTERAAVARYRLELVAEIALARAAGLAETATVPARAFDALLRLAHEPGRYARRIEALRVLDGLARGGQLDRARVETAVSLCRSLIDPQEHRWVQPAAYDLLTTLDAPGAVAAARARFHEARRGDDFLVRERLVELAARRQGAGWAPILEAATRDASEHVRLTAARLMTDPSRLGALARDDASAKVRARALLTLGANQPETATSELLRALVEDAAPLVVETAARGLATIAKLQRLRSRKEAVAALCDAAQRADVPERTRTAVVEELAAVEVLADPHLRVVHDLLADVLERVAVGGSAHVGGAGLAGVTEEQLGRVLSVLAQDDFGLSAERAAGGFVLHRGEDRATRPWRMLFELRRPQPSKRQGYAHAWGRVLRGALRAPPRGLAELTATNVPGERVLVAKRGDWGRHLPLVDDLLATALLSRAPVDLYGPSGRTRIEVPATFGARLVARAALTLGYARFAEQRRRALESNEPGVQRSYVDAITRATGLRILFRPYAFTTTLAPPPELPVRDDGATSPRPSRPAAMSGLLLGALPISQLVDGVSDLAHYAVRSEGNRLPHVAAYATLTLLGMITRAIVVRRAIDHDRKAMPLVIGGWGTRGKSGTERLKAGLFQGLGYEVLVKTTGCEAMFIHAVPGLRAQEVFIYRPYDKATIWEQRDLLRLARRFGARAFLWECMALQPDLVNVLQAQWMRDDYSTITNAYPDHEDVQGPAGYDVAQVISEFVPTNGRLFTSEDQMLPLLRERAKQRNTPLRAVREIDAALIADDVLARFPYHEHPRNIALVCALAQGLGVPTAVALAEMADNVVPDLGVLKTYPRVSYLGRSIAFTNGMSANERTGALSNWTRMAFDRHTADEDPKRWIVTVVNNRADRVARSEVFARFIVDDIDAHQHVLIGTNVSGLLGFVHEALDRHVADRSPTKDLAGSPAEQQALVGARIEKAFQRLKIGAATASSVNAELTALSQPLLERAVVDRMLAYASGESLSEARAAVAAAMPEGYPEEARPFVISTVLRRRRVAAVRALAKDHALLAPARVDAAFRDAYRELFVERLVVIGDSTMTGDKLIDRLVRGAPPGAEIDVMGVQNIKGTGLDFVYRWVSLEAVTRSLAKVRSSSLVDQRQGLAELLAHDDCGFIDATEAVRILESSRPTIASELGPELDAVLSQMRARVDARGKAIQEKRAKSVGDRIRLLVGTTFDYLDSVRRQSTAKRVLEDLIAGRISHAAAALEMRAVVARAKGAWALGTAKG